MKMFTVTEARANLTAVLDRARNGEDIGIVSGNQIVQLKPVGVVAWEDSYLYQEYNVSPEQWERFKHRLHKRREKAIRNGTLKVFSGNIEKDCAD
jgi:antitoxin (DNA-binding transcriptional repressor) of toxin-antitoxin stability system